MHQSVRTQKVRQKARQFVHDTWQSEANLAFFLGLIVVMTFVLPLTNFVGEHVNVYTDVACSLALISGVAITWRHGKIFYLALLLGLVSLVIRWTCWVHPQLLPLREAMMLANIMLFCAVLLREVLAKGHVTAMRIQGAIAVYLLLGIAWAHAYALASAHNPHAFAVQTGTPSTVSEWLYYSFITLTTVGYGDIVPTSRVARVLSMGEALTGQLYLAVMLARLVALQVSESMTPSE
jgi:voltage-gated potassium channel Kch